MPKRVSLKVPLRSQPYGHGWCVPAATQMVLAFYGDEPALKDIAKAMGVPKHDGVDIFKASLYLLRRGYRVRLMLWESDFPASFGRTKGPLSKTQFMAWANRTVRNQSWIRASGKKYGREFFERGGEIVAKATSVGMIRAALRRRRPPIIIVNVVTLWQSGSGEAPHAVVPVALSERHIVLNDPSPTRKRTTYGIDEFLHAFYRSNGQAMFIRPRR